jgi:hypothetical protein
MGPTCVCESILWIKHISETPSPVACRSGLVERSVNDFLRVIHSVDIPVRRVCRHDVGMDTSLASPSEDPAWLDHQCFDVVWHEDADGVSPVIFEVWPPFPTTAEIFAMFPDAFDVPPF